MSLDIVQKRAAEVVNPVTALGMRSEVSKIRCVRDMDYITIHINKKNDDCNKPNPDVQKLSSSINRDQSVANSFNCHSLASLKSSLLISSHSPQNLLTVSRSTESLPSPNVDRQLQQERDVSSSSPAQIVVKKNEKLEPSSSDRIMAAGLAGSGPCLPAFIAAAALHNQNLQLLQQQKAIICLILKF
uniref:Uncharacterized protein n=1 Tax=Romanomermis culicivorax TaxID=13658 RepID=A0A915IZD2_ROMCU